MSSATVKHTQALTVTCPILLSSFNQFWICSTDFHKSTQYKISRKSVQRTDVTKLVGAFRDYTNAMKIPVPP